MNEIIFKLKLLNIEKNFVIYFLILFFFIIWILIFKPLFLNFILIK